MEADRHDSAKAHRSSSNQKQLILSRIFTPLPSTSKDRVTIDINDAMFNDACESVGPPRSPSGPGAKGGARGSPESADDGLCDGSRSDASRTEEPSDDFKTASAETSSDSAIFNDCSDAPNDDSNRATDGGADRPDSPESFFEVPIVDVGEDDSDRYIDVVSLDATVASGADASEGSVPAESASVPSAPPKAEPRSAEPYPADSDCEIVDPNPQERRRLLDCDRCEYSLKSRKRRLRKLDDMKRKKRRQEVVEVEDDAPSEDAASSGVLSPVESGDVRERFSSTIYNILNPALMIFDEILHTPKFRPSRSQRIVDTVDLSGEPVVDEVIVIDSDASMTIDSPARVDGGRWPRAESAVRVDPGSRPVVVESFDGPAEREGGPVVRLHDCPICLDNFSTRKPAASTFCGHVFCKPCMKVVMKTSKKCPTCRKTLKGKGFHLLFL